MMNKEHEIWGWGCRALRRLEESRNFLLSSPSAIPTYWEDDSLAARVKDRQFEWAVAHAGAAFWVSVAMETYVNEYYSHQVLFGDPQPEACQ